MGRHQELELLEDLLEEGCGGSPRILFVTGEPGIGKTSLLAELRRRAESRGCLSLHGSAAEFERELPFGPVVDAFDEYLESLDPQAFDRLASEDLAELAGVFPALRSLDPGSGGPSTAAERFRAHRAVRALIEHLAAAQPLVLLLDDLHWADAASVELACHLLRRPPNAPVIVAAAFRTGQADRALETAMEAAVRDFGLVHRIPLGPLARPDAERLVDVPDAAERERLYRASGGNPFYMLQLALIGGGGASAVGASGDHAVPAAVVAAIVGELDGLASPARRLAEAAAVVGDPFELDLAVEVAGVAESEALVALDQLIARGLVRAGTVPRRFHFRHPLVRRAVYESCSTGVRLAAHQRTARALAQRGAPAVARAHHVAHSAHPGDMAALAVLREAGDAAARRAPVSAARWFEIALRLLPEAAPPEERVGLLMALAAARAATGGFADSRSALLECVDLTPRDDELLRVRLIGACAGVEQHLGRHEEAHARLTTALDALSDPASSQAVELMLHLAGGEFYRMDYQAMRDWGERALTIARPLGEPPLTAAGTAVLAVGEAFIGAISQAQEHAAEAAAIVDPLRDEELGERLDSLVNLSVAELYLHRYEDAASHARRGLAIARATGQGEMSPILVPVLSAALHTSGRVTEASELLDEAVEAARLLGNVEALGWNLLSRGFTAVAAGDLDLALDVARESVEVTRGLDDRLVSTNAGLAFADALFEAGEPRRAVDVLVAAAGGDELPRIPGGWRANYFELLTRCWLALGRPAEAAQAARRTAGAADSLGLGQATAMAHRAAAAVALDQGDPATAAERAGAAAEMADEIGAPVDAAVSRILAGRALAQAGQRDRGISELERAARQLDACGANRYRKQAEHELRKLGRAVHRRTSPGRAGGTGMERLTQREAEVARLVVHRSTNPQIADELVLSVKTIETHMRNIFRKLDVSSRVEVARMVEDDDRVRGRPRDVVTARPSTRTAR